MRARAKVFSHAAALQEDGTILAEGGSPVELPDGWTPEHLVLAAVARCTVKSLRYHARDLAVTASATMWSTVTRREVDGRYAVVELEVEVDARLDPEPPPEQLAELLARAERDCFVGNSLTVRPVYRWRVNGGPAEAASA
jgi:uncharacterized OsmC-like protein